MPVAQKTLFVIGWLFAIHALADVAVAIYRTHDVNRVMTDVLAGSL